MFRDVDTVEPAPPRRRGLGRLTIAAMAACAVIGGAAGWLSTAPVYCAEGSVTVPGARQCVFYWEGRPAATESGAGVIDARLEAMAARVASTRFVHGAVARLASGPTPVSRHEVSEGLRVRVLKDDPEEPELVVRFEHRDPFVAASVVDALIAEQLDCAANEAKGGTDRIDKLKAELARYEAAPDDAASRERCELIRARLRDLEAECVFYWEGRLPPGIVAVRRPTTPAAPARDRRAPLAFTGALVSLALTFGAAAVLRR